MQSRPQQPIPYEHRNSPVSAISSSTTSSQAMYHPQHGHGHYSQMQQPQMPQMPQMPPHPQHPQHPMQIQQIQPQAPQGPQPGQEFRRGNRLYSLVVRQQPVRARMCGFGDKDRRPITSPPCIELIIRDAETGNRIDPNEIDSTYFVLTVDLWDKDASAEVNLVRHSGNSPAVSISTSTAVPYPPPPERTYAFTGGMMYGGGYPPGSIPPGYGSYGAGAYSSGMNYPPPSIVTVPTHPTTGMFTRNLIGSLSVNAFKLQDTEQKTGFWFILQDLSVRTEGLFRLKMNFVDVGEETPNGLTLNKGRANVLATAFSDMFQVYSAKKFPGVIESTALSKAFASQGIKIPIRKDGPKDGEGGKKGDDDYDGDD